MDGYISEVRLFGGNFAPRNWALCLGQVINIASNTALFSLLGVNFGGNGTTNFALPNLAGRMPVGVGAGPGLPSVSIGEMGGNISTVMSTSNLPGHNHSLSTGIVALATVADGDSNSPGPTSFPAINGANRFGTTSGSTSMTLVNNLTINAAGSGVPIATMMPYLGLNYIICMFGIYPSRN